MLAKRKGASLKEVRSKPATRRTETGYEAGRSGRASSVLQSPYPPRLRAVYPAGVRGRRSDLPRQSRVVVSMERLSKPQGEPNAARKSAEGIVEGDNLSRRPERCPCASRGKCEWSEGGLSHESQAAEKTTAVAFLRGRQG